jgi:hypothetical protein
MSVDTFSFVIDRGHVLMFARAIGQAVPAEDIDGLLLDVPPTFVQCSAHFDPDYHLRPTPGSPWFGSGYHKTGDEAAARARSGSMHAEQHFEYVRPLNIGDRVTVRRHPGSSWKRESRRGDNLHFTEHITEYSSDGAVAVRARMVVVRVEPAEAEP